LSLVRGQLLVIADLATDNGPLATSHGHFLSKSSKNKSNHCQNPRQIDRSDKPVIQCANLPCFFQLHLFILMDIFGNKKSQQEKIDFDLSLLKLRDDYHRDDHIEKGAENRQV